MGYRHSKDDDADGHCTRGHERSASETSFAIRFGVLHNAVREADVEEGRAVAAPVS